MTTAQNVFDTTMALIDEVNESTGATDTSDTREYKQRTLAILNLLRGELYPYSDTFEKGEGKTRPIVKIITDFNEPILLDDYICQSVLPYGLAAHLLLDENPSAAGFFNGRYNELKAMLQRGLGGVSEDITDVYGGLKYNDFSRW